MAPSTTWLLVADAARARLFEIDVTKKTLLRTPLHELAVEPLMSQEIASDRPGRTFDRAGEGRHAKAPPTDPQRFEKERFARQVSDLLAVEFAAKAFDRLAVAAPPQMLGDLRAVMDPAVRAAVVAETGKDLAMLAPHEIEARLDQLLAS